MSRELPSNIENKKVKGNLKLLVKYSLLVRFPPKFILSISVKIYKTKYFSFPAAKFVA